MLEEIRIRSLGVIDQAHIEFSPGFTVLTGETGAGKTMVLTALGLVLGQKAEATLIRSGADRTAVAATFSVPDAVAQSVGEQGGEVEDGRVVLARMISTDGRSRALVGGAAAPAATLAEIGEEVISVHAQMSTTRLLKGARQRDLLDQFGQLEPLLKTYRASFANLRSLEKQLEQVLSDSANAKSLSSEFRTLIELVDETSPQAGEYQELESTISRLSHHDEIVRAVSQAYASAHSENGLVDSASEVQRSLESVKGRDHTLDEIASRAIDISVLASDLAADLSRYQDSLDIEPGDLDVAHARMAKIQSLLRRFSCELSASGLSDLMDRYQAAQERLLVLDSGEAAVAALMAQIETVKIQAAAAAEALSAARAEAAVALGAAVTDEVRALAMPNATVLVALSQREEEGGLRIAGRELACDASGVDTVEFRLSATSSAPAVPVAKGASGGELSRVMLGLEVALAATDPVATYVFDEVDAGIGGSAALEVGRRLARLARTSQVIVVTHLAQVAAFADQHIVVAKNGAGSVTESTLQVVSGAEREAELARMMAGLADSASAQASAAELLALGARPK